MDDLFQKYLESAIHFLSYRMRSEKEVRDNLIKKKASPEIIEKVITWLKEQRFVNDREFARLWIESRARSQPKSLRIIQMELRQKGVSKDILSEVATHPDTVVGSDLDRAKKLVEKKIGKYKDLPKHELYQKLGAVLARRGFSWDIIKRSIDDVIGMGYNNE